MARTTEKLEITEIKNWKFYWAPPKKYYNAGQLKFFNYEYTFILPSTTQPIVVVVNTEEDFDENTFDWLHGSFETNYFFNVDDVPDKARQKVIVAIFNIPSFIKEYVKV